MKCLLTLIFLSLLRPPLQAQSWTMQNVGFQKIGADPFKVSIVDANVAWTIGDYHLGEQVDREFSKTIDGGISWQAGTLPVPANYSCVSVCAIDENIAYIDCYQATAPFGGHVYRTLDGGTTWNETGANVIFTDPASVCDGIYFWNAAEGFAFGDPVNGEWEMYTTADSGNTWTAVPAENIPDAAANDWAYPKSYTVIDSCIWIGSHQGYIYKSMDRGMHWTSVQLTDAGFVQPVFFSDKKTGIAIGYSWSTGALNYFRTSDGGDTWTAFVAGGRPYFFFTAIPGTNYLVSCEDNVIDQEGGSSYSADTGKTWIPIDTIGDGCDYGYFWVTFHDINTGYATGFVNADHTGGIFKWNPGNLGIHEIKTAGELKVYPNPSSDVVEVSGDFSFSSQNLLRVFDMNGKLHKEIQLDGEKEFTLNVSDLQPGIYSISVIASNEVSQSKFIISR